MTRERRAPRRGEAPPAARRGARDVAIVLIAVVLVVVGAFAWWRLRPAEPPAPAAASGPTVAVLAESVRVAIVGRDWDTAQRLLAELHAREPKSPRWLLATAVALHNAAWLESGPGRTRTACRTSLDRARMEQAAFAALDSAATSAFGTSDWARARMRAAQIDEHLGLFGDALDACADVERRDPTNREATLRDAALRQQLRSPGR